MKVAIYSRGVDLDQQQSLNALLSELNRYDSTIYVFADLIEKFDLNEASGKNALIPFTSILDLQNIVDCLISLGGDGTVLDTVTIVGNTTIPILGINYGRLGFLATISKDELSIMVEALVNRSYVIEKRSLLHLDSNLPIFGSAPYALNEFAIHKRDTSPMIKIHTYLNGEFLNSYWADGIIVATPTGSTGYNMSCNGPILFPDSASFVITPVAPHNLNVRSNCYVGKTLEEVLLDIKIPIKSFMPMRDTARYDIFRGMHLYLYQWGTVENQQIENKRINEILILFETPIPTMLFRSLIDKTNTFLWSSNIHNFLKLRKITRLGVVNSTQMPQDIVLNSDESNSTRNYNARHSIILKPSFKFTPSSGKFFNAKIVP